MNRNSVYTPSHRTTTTTLTGEKYQARSALFGGGSHNKNQERDSSNFSVSVENDEQIKMLEQQDQKDVSALSSSISTLRKYAYAIQDEISRHNVILGDLEGEMEQGRSRLNKLMRHINRLASSSSSSHMCLLILFFIVVIFVLYFIFKWRN